MDIDLNKIGVTQRYLDKYYMSDEAIYVRYKTTRRRLDKHEKHFIKWFENGKKPLPRPNFYAIRSMLVPMMQEGLTMEDFESGVKGVSHATLRRLYYSYEDISERSCAKVVKNIEEFYKKWLSTKS